MWKYFLKILIFSTFYTGIACKTISLAQLAQQYNETAISVKIYVNWPNATVPFYVNPEHFDEEQSMDILSALSMFSFKTCVKFAPVMAAPKSDEHILVVENPDGVKRCVVDTMGHSVFEPHRLILGYQCLHSPDIDMMVMRSLGLPFEHNKISRDIYIDVLTENIESGYTDLFTKETTEALELRGLPYDINSVMHFGHRDYSKNGHRTIMFKNPSTKQVRTGLTSLDLRKIDLVYGPECRARDRQEKRDLCQSYPGVARRKRSIDERVSCIEHRGGRYKRDTDDQDVTEPDTDRNRDANESKQAKTDAIQAENDKKDAPKSLRVNPNITPPPNVNELNLEKKADAMAANLDSGVKEGDSEQTSDVEDDHGEESKAHETIEEEDNIDKDIHSELEEKLTSIPAERIDARRQGIRNRKMFTKWDDMDYVEPTEKTFYERYQSDTEVESDKSLDSVEEHKRILRVKDSKYEKRFNELIGRSDSEDNINIKKGETDHEEYQPEEIYTKRETKTTKHTFNELQSKARYKKVHKTDTQERFSIFHRDDKYSKHDEKENELTKKRKSRKTKHKKNKLTTKEIKFSTSEEYDRHSLTEPTQKSDWKTMFVKDSESDSKDKKNKIKKRRQKLQQKEDEENSNSKSNSKEKVMVHKKKKTVIQSDSEENSDSKSNSEEKVMFNDMRQTASPSDSDKKDTRKKRTDKLRQRKEEKTEQESQMLQTFDDKLIVDDLPRLVKLSKDNEEFYRDRRWPGGEVRYVISEDNTYDTTDLRRRIGEVNDILKNKTCILLKELTEDLATDYEDYLVIDTSPDYVTGRVGRRQSFGSIELFEGGQHRQHTAMMVMAWLGFYFEVARHDRDKYVRVHNRHIRADKLHHFEKMYAEATLPLPYDFASATHPSWQFWRKVGRKGISSVATYKDHDPDSSIMKSMGQNADLLSPIDIVKINSVYGLSCKRRSKKNKNKTIKKHSQKDL